MCLNNFQVYKEAWLCVFSALLPKGVLSRLSCQSMKSTWQHCYTGILVKARDFGMPVQPSWLRDSVLWSITINPCHIPHGVRHHRILCPFYCEGNYSNVLNVNAEKSICFLYLDSQVRMEQRLELKKIKKIKKSMWPFVAPNTSILYLDILQASLEGILLT